MNKILLYLIIFTTLIPDSFSQCGSYSKYLMPGLSKVRFWDIDNGFTLGVRSLMTTHDGGQSWESYEPYLNGHKKAEIISTESAIIVGRHGFMLFTDDKGASWQRKVGITGNEMYADVFVLNENILFLTGIIVNTNSSQTPFLYKSEDGGLSWIEIEINYEGFSSGLNPDRIFFFNENVGYIIDDQRIYKTIDGGVNWVESQNPGGNGNISKYQVIDNQTAFLKADDNLFKTEDQGNTWTEIIGGNELYAHSFFVENEYLYYGRFVLGGIKKRNLNTGLVESSVINLPSVLTDIYFVDSQNGFAVGSDFYNDNIGRFIYKTTDGGLTWIEVDSGVNFPLPGGASLYGYFGKMDDNKLVYASIKTGSVDQNYIHLSKDNGDTWKIIKRVENSIGKVLYASGDYLSHWRFANPNNYADDFIISESFDNGETWQDSPEFSKPNGIISESFKQVTENDIFVYDYDFLYHSTDRGVTWELISIPSIAGGGKYFFKNENEFVLYAKNPSTDNPIFYKTIDGGQTWTLVSELYYTYGSNDDIIKYTLNDELVIYSRNANLIFKFNLISGTSSTVSMGFPIDQLEILNENIYLAKSNSNLYISYDEGGNWIENEEIFVQNDEIIYGEESNNFFIWNENGIKHYKDYIPSAPEFILGNTDTFVNVEEEYIIPSNFFAGAEWELDSGGDLIIDSETSHFKVKVLWYSAGQHTLKVKHFNDCGESVYTSILVNVENDIVVDDLPIDNFLIETISETCSNLNNGAINVQANQILNYEYVLTLNGNEIETGNFDEAIRIEDLESGQYELCISVVNTEIERCFDILVTEPEDIQGRSTLIDNNYTIYLTGATHYFININGIDHEIFSNYVNEEIQFSINLNQNDNQISVRSDKACQKVYNEYVSLNTKSLILLPNPTNNITKLTFYSENGDLGLLNIYDITGKLLESNTLSLPIVNHEIDFSSYEKGFYLVLLKTKNKLYKTKIIKN